METNFAIIIKKLELRIGQMELEMLNMKGKIHSLESEVATLKGEKLKKNEQIEDPLNFPVDRIQYREEFQAFDDSRIISRNRFSVPQKQEFFRKILGDIPSKSWDLVMYQSGSEFIEHGYTTFKKGVGDREGSLVVIRNFDNEIFGGFASVRWPYTNSWIDDPGVFLFRFDGTSESWEKLVSREGSTKMMIYNGPKKHTCYFGRWEGCWIDVENNGVRSYNFGNGKREFKIREIEVFCVKK